METFCQIALFGLSLLVFFSVLLGLVFWVLYFLGRNRWNLIGERSPELITRLPQAAPRWTFVDFVFAFGVSLTLTSVLTLAVRKPSAVPAESATKPATVQIDAAAASAGTESAVSDENASQDVASEEAASNDLASDNETSKPVAVLQPAVIVMGILAGVLTIALVLGLMSMLYRTSPREMGVTPQAGDIRRGVVATVWILAPVIVINVVVAQLIAYRHPVTDTLAQQNDWQISLLLFISAAIVTPVLEELLFRMLLQGGLQVAAEGLAAVPGIDALTDAQREATADWKPTKMWPILVSSLVFALLHLGQGGAPIPLFFLAVGLGFLYQRTGRLTPCIVVHMLLNGTMLLIEFSKLGAGVE